MSQTPDQELLSKLYECQEMMLNLYSEDKNNENYMVISDLIQYIENKIVNDAGFVGL